MNRIIGWARALRLRRRDKRVERLGGYPGQDPKVQVERFTPELSRTQRLEQILGGVSTLGAESVDEATGHPLDNLVNADGVDWRHRLQQQYFAYLASAQHILARAEAIVAQYQRLHAEDQSRLQNAERAVETALLTLTGYEPEPAADVLASERTASPQRPDLRPAPAQQPGALVTAPPGAALPDWPVARAALVPPQASHSELRRLLDPQDADRVPRWGDPGFRDGTLLAGRPRSAYVHALVLLLAAGADLGAFVQVVELVLPQQDWVIWLVVGGLTAVVLYIAHTVGVMLREARARSSAARGLARLRSWLGQRLGAFVCTVIWLALGLMAFWVRLTVPLTGTVQLGSGGIGSGGIGSGGIGSGGIGSGGIGSGGIGSGATTSGTTTGSHTLQGAAIFLGLYIATGIVAAVGAYFTHNPYRGRYVATLRAYRKASERAAASAYQFGLALAFRQHQQTEIEAAELVLAEAHEQNRAFTEQLKQSVRIKIAGQARDPAVTDAIFEADHSPYWPDGDGPPPDGTEPGAPQS